MSTTALQPPSSHITDRYLFRSLSNDSGSNRNSSSRKTRLPQPTPSQRKRYKFSTNPTDQNDISVYKFPTSTNEVRSHSTDSNRYYFTPDNAAAQSKQKLSYIQTGNGLEQRPVSFIGGTVTPIDKTLSATKSTPTTNLTPDTPYLFSKPKETQRNQSATSSPAIAEGKRFNRVFIKYRDPENETHPS